MDLVLSMFDAYDRGADTSCVVDAQGNIAEGPGFNVFMVKDGVVRTPDRGVLEGISRKTVIELCGALAIPLRVAPVPAAELAAADEVFLSSTGGGVLPIARIDGRPLLDWPGPVTRRLHDAYWALHDDPAPSRSDRALTEALPAPGSPRRPVAGLQSGLSRTTWDPWPPAAARRSADSPLPAGAYFSPSSARTESAMNSSTAAGPAPDPVRLGVRRPLRRARRARRSRRRRAPSPCAAVAARWRRRSSGSRAWS